MAGSPSSSPAPSGVHPPAAGEPISPAPHPLNAPSLAGIRRLSALDAVRARIALAVDLGLLRPGERLPPGDRIAEALDTSEITVRRALVALCREGVLERRRGRTGGTLVAEHPPRGAVDAVASYRAAAPDVHALIDHRLVLECGIAHLAAVREPDEAAGRELDRLVAEMERAQSWAEFHRWDERFHLAVAAATGLPSVVEPYGRALKELYRYYLPYPLAHLRESNAEHRALAEAVRRADPAAAAEVARRHVQTLHESMFMHLLGDS
ncbi:GntR family transcriptional regulator [Streptomyces sp. Ru73]|uniref:FadR/GntR family transcriptional regulator n=1 Tax=Streptomyces sp. Ru73 TaxID=2080748 RepID=UPI000CDE50E3|nr:FCD domain-containing protein [Streptomyces sp. Ru73]POX38707.1 GntR family transcriptional regulator [Streptomyces sp. Ru73]